MNKIRQIHISRSIFDEKNWRKYCVWQVTWAEIDGKKEVLTKNCEVQVPDPDPEISSNQKN